MEKSVEAYRKMALDQMEENRRYFKKIKKRNRRGLDDTMQELHDQEFERTDCLTCGNCCKTTSPIFTEKDIVRISKHLRMKQTDFIDQFLEMDQDNFWVLKTAPCHFLMEDNACMIYEVRPKACKEYPHTNRRRFFQLTELTLKNTLICPAAFRIVEALKQKMPL